MKEWIFISHVTPKNNYQAAWVEAKLSLLGYKVWVDIKDLRGGDSFWPEIQGKIQLHTAKFLPIVTKDYIDRAITPKTGVRMEISCAHGVRDVPNFIVPLRFDDSAYTQFPIEFQEMNGFDFSSNWAEGLKKLVKELEKSEIPKFNNGDNYIKKWFDALEIRNDLLKKQETYYTNWLPITLPANIYIHEPEALDEAQLRLLGYPFISESVYIITFMNRSLMEKHFEIRNSFEFATEKFLLRDDIPISSHYIAVEPNKKLVQLLNETFKVFLKSQGLHTYNQSGDKEIFYFPKKEGDKKKISLKVFGKSNKAINGKSGDVLWNYAVAANAKLFPVTHYKISHHLYFEKQGKSLDKEAQQENRRSIANNWFNKDWLDMLLAFFQKLKNHQTENKVFIPVSSDDSVVIDCEPIKFVSEVGYIEPNSEDREVEENTSAKQVEADIEIPGE